ncbi:MAG: hypothetical protein LQ351_004285 [Letrouitia transgressa]|nr:MAG: hypothetical protein LQ351_004285 [Letrouitia transgressa]
MSTTWEGPNPLRPYYVPPTSGRTSGTAQNAASTSNIQNRYSTPSSEGHARFGSSARNILPDINYSDYLSESSPSSIDTLKTLAEQALWKYTSVFLAQPFEVAKTVLQVRAPSTTQDGLSQAALDRDLRKRRLRQHDHTYRDLEVSSNSDEDSPSYFTSNAPLMQGPSRQSRPRRRQVLLSTITSFARSFLAAIFAIPDPSLSLQGFQTYGLTGGLDILNSPTPIASLSVAVSAACIAGVVLAPLDIARIKLMLTPSTHPPRSVMSNLKSLLSWTMPLSIAPATFLHSTLPTLMSASLPLVLRSKMGIDPLLTPNLYAVAAFIGQGFELAVKLPIETVLRRGQIIVARSTIEGRESETVVEIGPYKGLVGTIFSVIYEEGERNQATPSRRDPKSTIAGQPNKLGRETPKRKGQGLEGLWRGWRVGMWGLIGVWGAQTLGGVGSKGGEF